MEFILFWDIQIILDFIYGQNIITFNPICFIVYLIVLFKFFDDRIKIEEELLI